MTTLTEFQSQRSLREFLDELLYPDSPAARSGSRAMFTFSTSSTRS
jgi:hypothetical protein